MPDLTAFLLARISEDEADANDAAKAVANGAQVWSKIHPDAVAYLSRVTPARVLAECETKRRIIAKHQRVKFTDVSLAIVNRDVCQKCHHAVDPPDEDHDDDWTYPLVQDDFPCKTLRYLATVYADHPDYDETWRAE